MVSAREVSKGYRLGQIGGATLKEDVARWWAKCRKQPDPLAVIGSANHVRRVGERVWALRDVSFDIEEGDIVGIIGRNGAGKSTLLKILAQVTAPTSGEVKIRGRVASLLEVGTGFHGELTGRENIYLNGAILGMSKAEIRRNLDEIIAFSGIEQFIDTPVKRYSSGMYVRLAFAVSAHLEAEILIIDEVLAVGDAEFQKKCIGKIENEARSGRTILFVSHNMQSVAKLTSRALYLVKGAVAFAGSTNDAINCYVNDEADDRLIYEDLRRDETIPSVAGIRLRTSREGNVHVNGDALTIEVTIWAPERINGACLSLQVFDAHQTNYLHVWLHDAETPFCRDRGLHQLVCYIPKLRLYMGTYRFRVFLSEPPGGAQFEILDGVCPFEVIMPDDQRLFIWYPNECAYLEESSWEVVHNLGE